MPEGIRRHGDGYQANVTINGKRRHKTFPTQGEAKRWRSAQLAAGAAGTWIDPRRSDMLLRDWLDRWMALARPSWSDGTYTRYESVARVHLVPELGHWTLTQVSTDRVQEWVNGKGATEAHTQWPVLSAAMKEAVRLGMVATTPDPKLPKRPKSQMQFLEPSEVREMVTMEDREWARDIILGLAFTGARLGELSAVTPEDVNLLKRDLHLPGTKNAHSDRTIHITGPLVEVLERRLSLGHDTVWGMASGSPINPQNLRKRVWHPLREAYGRPTLRLHDLRHSAASLLINAGHNPVQVCRWMGHANPTQTLNTYAHLFRADMGDMAASIARLWDEKPLDNVVALGAGGTQVAQGGGAE